MKKGSNVNNRINFLKEKAKNTRLNVVRMLKAYPKGHVGGAFSLIDIITVLYFDYLDDERGDRFVLSAGHKCLAQYAILAEKGIFPKSILDTYGALDTKLPGHPDMHKLPGIKANTGALGHGLAIACGMAFSNRLDARDGTEYVALGDGEMSEGSNWEALSFASHHNLSNLVAILDYNKLQISGKVSDIMNIEPIADRVKAFGWKVYSINGHNFSEIIEALDNAQKETQPTFIIANTIKGKGLVRGAGEAACHYWKATPEDLDGLEASLQAEGVD